MGDYAYRKSDKKEIKVGTCGSMYYLTFQQWANGDVCGGDVAGLIDVLPAITFRLPMENEKDIKAGDFDFYGFHGAEPIKILFKQRYVDKEHNNYEETPFVKEIHGWAMKNPSFIQLRNEYAGIMRCVPCYHGWLAPEEEVKQEKIGYNGFNDNVLCLTSVGFTHQMEAVVNVSCYACGQSICALSVDELDNLHSIGEGRKDFQNVVDCLHYMNEWAEQHRKELKPYAK